GGFRHGFADVAWDRKRGYINKKGVWVWKPSYCGDASGRSFIVIGSALVTNSPHRTPKGSPG
ncbi:MAG: hypothetical protein ACK54R_04245, partial [Pirellulaceae bacterium]